MFSNMQAILANLVVPVVRLLLFIAVYAAIKFIQTTAAIYKAEKEAKIRDQEHAARIRRAKRAVKELSPDLKEAARDSPYTDAMADIFCSASGSPTNSSKDIVPSAESREAISVTLSR